MKPLPSHVPLCYGGNLWVDPIEGVLCGVFQFWLFVNKTGQPFLYSCFSFSNNCLWRGCLRKFIKGKLWDVYHPETCLWNVLSIWLFLKQIFFNFGIAVQKVLNFEISYVKNIYWEIFVLKMNFLLEVDFGITPENRFETFLRGKKTAKRFLDRLSQLAVICRRNSNFCANVVLYKSTCLYFIVWLY